MIKFIIYTLGVIMLLAFCAKKDNSSDIKIELPPVGEDESEGEEVDEVDYPMQTLGYNWLITTNTANDQIEIYAPDVADWNNPEALKWSFKPSSALGWNTTEVLYWDYPQNVRFRENEIYEGQCIAAVGNRLVLIASYPDGTRKWSADIGENMDPQSVEILPDGNLAVAACKGNWIRVYTASQGSSQLTFTQFDLLNASSVLRDDKSNCLWVGGKINGDEGQAVLTALSVEGTPEVPSLKEITSLRIFLPEEDECTDISSFIGNPDKLWVNSKNGLYIYNKTTKSFSSVAGFERQDSFISVANQPDGTIVVLTDEGQNASGSVQFYTQEGRQSSRTKKEAKFTSLHPCNPNYSFRSDYRIATYNIRSANIKEDYPERYWSNRNPLVQDMVKKYDFDIFGVQEAWKIQLNDLDSLKSYSHFGISINGDNTRAFDDIFLKKPGLSF